VAGLSGPDGEHAAPAAVLGRALDERGSTLLELLVATAIMGIAVVAMLVGSSLTFTSSGANRQSTTAGIVARSYAEDLALAIPSGGGWCSYPSPYVVPLTFTMPATVSSVANVPGPCPAADPTVPQYQTVTITVNALNGSSETLIDVVREP
jgi:prepilin-type N-terminal cleavage/methylation domain-containing protein